VIKNNFFYKNNIQKKYLKKRLLKKYSANFNKVFNNVISEINNPNKTLSILSNKFQFNYEIRDLNRFQKFKTIVLIGMGGSILGAEAIYNFLETKIKKKIFFFDNLNERQISNLKKNENLNKILFLIISKSGNTVETISNSFSLNILKKGAKNIIIISEKKNNLLNNLSKKLNLFHIEHKHFIGGRYSVLSEVGTVPANLMGVDTNKLRSNLDLFLKRDKKIFLKNSTIKLANLLFENKINNLIFLNYCPELEKFLFWCQQLISESLGKKGKGFLPVISKAPKDHHSLLQLYLDGPKDKFFHIFSNEEKLNEAVNFKKIFKINNFLDNKTLSDIKVAQKNALIKALKKNKIPFREFKIKSRDEAVLGQLFSYFILETVIIGKLINTNPYDQPAVEQVKAYTKDFLS
jgi:glucose-6-phosphate isomerase